MLYVAVSPVSAHSDVRCRRISLSRQQPLERLHQLRQQGLVQLSTIFSRVLFIWRAQILTLQLTPTQGSQGHSDGEGYIGIYTPPNQSTLNFLCGCFVSLTQDKFDIVQFLPTQIKFLATPLKAVGELFSRLERRSLPELTRETAPPIENGHAPPPSESTKSSQSANFYSVSLILLPCKKTSILFIITVSGVRTRWVPVNWIAMFSVSK